MHHNKLDFNAIRIICYLQGQGHYEDSSNRILTVSHIYLYLLMILSSLMIHHRHHGVFIVDSGVWNVVCSLLTVVCEMWSVHCWQWCVWCGLFIVDSGVCDVVCSLLTVVCEMWCVHCWQWCVKCVTFMLLTLACELLTMLLELLKQGFVSVDHVVWTVDTRCCVCWQWKGLSMSAFVGMPSPPRVDSPSSTSCMKVIEQSP